MSILGSVLAGFTGVPCARTNCTGRSWNGKEGGYCTKACRDRLATLQPSCQAAGCNKPTFNALPGYCSRSCRDGSAGDTAPAAFARCKNPSCPCPASFNGQEGEHCCKRCAQGEPCSVATHLAPDMPAVPEGPGRSRQPRKFARCANPDCVCTSSYSGRADDYCCKACKRGTPCTRNVHTQPQKLASDEYTCAAGCGRKTHNGLAGEFCGRTCQTKFAKLNPSVPLTDYHKIKVLADAWLRGCWPQSLGRISCFYGNPGLGDPACPAVQKWQAALSAKGCTSTSQSEFAWHGTKTVDALRSICWSGIDPSMRSGQAYGRGEYFSIDASISGGYAGSTGYLIVFVLLQVPENSKKNGAVYRVVDNPTSGAVLYCLPIGVVSYLGSSNPQMQGSGIFARAHKGGA